MNNVTDDPLRMQLAKKKNPLDPDGTLPNAGKGGEQYLEAAPGLTDKQMASLSEGAQLAIGPGLKTFGAPDVNPGAKDTTTVNIDGGSVTVPNDKVADTFKALGLGPTDKEYLASLGIDESNPEFNRMMGFEREAGGRGQQAGGDDFLRANLHPSGGIQSSGLSSQPSPHPSTDAMGLTQGDRRNILRSQGVGGSEQIAQAKLMGAQNNMKASMLDNRTGQGQSLSPDKRATAIGEIEALGGDPNIAAQLSDEQLLASLAREKTRRQLDRENEQRELTQGTTMGKLEAYGYDPAQLEQMSPGERQRALTRMETQAALRPEETPKPVPVDIDGDGVTDYVTYGSTIKEHKRPEEKPQLKFETDPKSKQRFMTYGNTVQQIRIDERELTALEKDLGAIDRQRQAAGLPPLSPDEKVQAMELYATRKAQGSGSESATQALLQFLAQKQGMDYERDSGAQNMFGRGSGGQSQQPGKPTAQEITEAFKFD